MTRRMVETGIYDGVSPQVSGLAPDPYAALAAAICGQAIHDLADPGGDLLAWLECGVWLAGEDAEMLFAFLGVDDPLRHFESFDDLRRAWSKGAAARAGGAYGRSRAKRTGDTVRPGAAGKAA